MQLRSFVGFFFSTAALLAWVGCSSDNNGTTPTADAGPTPENDAGPTPENDAGPDAETCGKLPATGASQPVARPTDSASGHEVGNEVKIALDKKGRPFIAWLDHPASSKQAVYVQRWDDCKGEWRAAQKVDENVSGDPGKASRSLALAIDPSDGHIALAYTRVTANAGANDSTPMYVATSTDDGATFGAAVKVSEGTTSASQPALVAGGGKTYVAYVQELIACPVGGSGCQTGAVLATITGTNITREIVKDSSDTAHGMGLNARSFPLGLALDSAGRPGVVVHIEPPTAYNTVLAYWRPGDATYVQITDSSNVQNDDGTASLAYDGLEPRVVSRLQQGPLSGVTDYNLVYSTSDNGTTWLTYALAPDHVQNTERMLARAGKVTIVGGGPHVFRSSDNATFAAADDLGLAQTSDGVDGVLDANGKLWAVVEGVVSKESGLGGVALYREP